MDDQEKHYMEPVCYMDYGFCPSLPSLLLGVLNAEL
jgi:hypothetical protein